MRDLALSNTSFVELNWGTYSAVSYRFPSVSTKLVVSSHPGLDRTDIPHYHDEAHMTFMLSGGAIDKRKNSESECNAGEMMFFHSGEVHQTINRVFPTKYITLSFTGEFLKRNDLTEAEIEAIAASRARSKFAMLKMYRELEVADEFLDASIEMLVLDLTSKKTALTRTRPGWVGAVHDLLHDEWNHDLTLDDLSRAVGVHPKTISRYFPKYFACTLGQYRRRIKVARSLPMIKASDLTLAEIAYECRFSDQSHFIRSFREFVGFPPKTYQKMN